LKFLKEDWKGETIMARQKPKSDEVTVDNQRQELGGEETPEFTREERYQMVAEAAYLIAEQRKFRGNEELDDWLRAESEVNGRLSEAR
jgi:DUF2934 family protein